MKIGLLGYGVVGGGVDAIISGRSDMEVKKVMSLVVPDAIKDRIVTDIDEIVNDEEIDTVVECMGGTEPAFTFVAKALSHGKNVVTSNKALVAKYYDELLSLSRENNCAFRCTAAVGGGIPWLTTLESVKRFDTINRISGIMNGTTNYILSQMTNNNKSYAEALKEAQELGFAERDPSADVDGYDTTRKICISANVAFDVKLQEEAIPVFGIRNVDVMDIRAAKNMGSTLKLMAYAERVSDGISAFTEPVMIPDSHQAAHIRAQFNIIRYETGFFDSQSLIGEGAGRYPTAANIIRDLTDVLNGIRSFYSVSYEEKDVKNDSVFHSYYVRTAEPDDYLQSIAVEKHSYYVITKKVPVSEMHAWASKKLQEDPALFIAGIQER